MHRRADARATLADLYAPIAADLSRCEAAFDAELAGDLPFIGELCDTVRTYRGKMLRPALLLLSAKATGAVTPEHHALAAVVEMVHVATLVHDDVLDEAQERRRQPTIRAIAGNVAAVLLGDYLISHAFHLCSSLQSQYASRLIGATTNRVCEGELLQNQQAGQEHFSESAYFDVIRRKTGALTATACELGARFAGAEDQITGRMRDYGLAAGVAFQIVDDVLDIVGDEGEVGKTLGLDFMLGKATLPVIHCLQAGGANAEAVRAALAGRDGCPPDHLRDRLAESGSIDYAMATATDYVSTALGRLEPLPPSPAKSSLTSLAEFIVRRRS
jgi:octaprenyl-diphosphate synthase